MITLHTEQRVAKAAEALAQLYRNIAPALRLSIQYKLGITLQHHCPVTAPESELPPIDTGLTGFIDVVRTTSMLHVSRENCASVYPTNMDNLWFRFVHDMGHMLYGCEFDTEGETELHSQLWHWIETCPLYWSLPLEEQRWVWCVYQADTQGQTDYFDQCGQFPEDQRAFVTKEARRLYTLHFEEN